MCSRTPAKRTGCTVCVSLQEDIGSSTSAANELAFETAVTGSPFVATESACDKGKAR